MFIVSVESVNQRLCGQGRKYVPCVPYCQLYCDTKSSQVFPICMKTAAIGCKPGCICDDSARFKTERGKCIPSCNFRSPAQNIKTTTLAPATTVKPSTGKLYKTIFIWFIWLRSGKVKLKYELCT